MGDSWETEIIRWEIFGTLFQFAPTFLLPTSSSLFRYFCLLPFVKAHISTTSLQYCLLSSVEILKCKLRVKIPKRPTPRTPFPSVHSSDGEEDEGMQPDTVQPSTSSQTDQSMSPSLAEPLSQPLPSLQLSPVVFCDVSLLQSCVPRKKSKPLLLTHQ